MNLMKSRPETMNDNLPKRKKAHGIGSSAVNLLISVLDRFANPIPVPLERDLGIDIKCELLDAELPTGFWFNIQCKGTEKVDISKDKISVPIKITTINYWQKQSEPTFLIMVDNIEKSFYWSYPQEFLGTLNKKWKSQKTVSIPIPQRNNFHIHCRALPLNMMEIVKRTPFEEYQKTFRKLSEKMKSMDSVKKLSPTLIDTSRQLNNEIDGIVKNATRILTANKELKQRIVDKIRSELDNCHKLIGQLSYIPEFKAHMQTNSIMTEPFGACMPEEVIHLAKSSLENYFQKPMKQNYERLLESAKRLLELNGDIGWVIWMTDRNTPYQPYLI